MRERLIGSLCVGVTAFLLARAAGLPAWVSWPTDWTLRDAADVGLCAFWGAWLLSRRDRAQ